jgi:DNA-directed RNA polymerase specialized sigma24 family protein
MNQKEINAYIKSRMPSVNMALNLIRDKLTYEEAEDAKQELLITMYKCILNYREEYHTTLDTYVMVSMNRRAGRFARDLHNGSRARERGAESLSTAFGDRVPLIDLLEDSHGNFTDRIDASAIVENALFQLDETTEGILRLWADKHTLQYIADVYGKSVHFIDDRVKSGIEQMKEIIGSV